MRIRGALVVTLSLMVSGLVACGGGEPEAHTPPPPSSAAASATPGPSQADLDAKKKADEEAAAKKKADEDAAAKKKADEEAAKKAEQAKADLVTAFAGSTAKFMLAYDKSDAFKKAKDEDCEKKNKADDKKAACKKAAADDSAKIGARMSKDAKNDKLVFIEIFTTDAKGKESLLHKFQVTPAVTGATAKLAVADKTKDMGGPMTALKAAPKELTVMASDGMTLSIESADWPLGKLVFTKG